MKLRVSGKTIRRGLVLILAVAGLTFLVTCTSQKSVQKSTVSSNVAFLYNPSSSPLHPEFTVYHEGNDYSKLYLKIFPVELLFNQANKEGTYQSRLQVRYESREIIDKTESDIIDDSATIVFNLKMNEIKNAFVTSIDFKSDLQKKYLLKIYTTDLLRNKGTVNYIVIDRSTANTAQNYRVTSAGTGVPSFDRIFKSSEIFRTQYNTGNVDQVIVKYFENDFPLPRPPVTNLLSPRPDFIAIADSIYSYNVSDTTNYILPMEGMYHIQVDPAQPEGMSVYNFGENFPRVNTVEEMIAPLAYLMSAIEFNELASQTNKKLAIDNFWLESAGNADRARELIRIYYNRVFFANYYFSSYKEGWKTDRGMMFIIYGPPNNLRKSALSENWTYYRKRSREPLRFTFNKVDNPYTDNDYLLQRNFVNSLWVQAVRDWRSGKVFYADN